MTEWVVAVSFLESLEMEPDVVQDSLAKLNEVEYNDHLIKLRETDQIKELQTVLRDKYVLIYKPTLLQCTVANNGSIDSVVIHCGVVDKGLN